MLEIIVTHIAVHEKKKTDKRKKHSPQNESA